MRQMVSSYLMPLLLKSTQAKKALRATADPVKAQFVRNYFKTAPGEYGHGDIFIGVTVPHVRNVAKMFFSLPLKECLFLLKSRIHEERMLALFILCAKYREGAESLQVKIHRTYLRNLKHVNNWDLVDASAPLLMGAHLGDRPKQPLYRLAKSKRLWDRRVAILATYSEIQNGRFTDALKISKILLEDSEDLIHKAVGWMLREIGKRDVKTLERFLKSHRKTMPRTMLRYAIEKFPEEKRKSYLRK